MVVNIIRNSKIKILPRHCW